MNTEDMYRAAHRLEQAAERASYAADRIETAVRDMKFMLEDGYGGNGLRLLQALDKLQEDEEAKLRASLMATGLGSGLPATLKEFEKLKRDIAEEQ